MTDLVVRKKPELASIARKIERFIIKYVSRSTANGLVIGLSGGLDSSVVLKLAVNALGPEKVFGLILPTSATPEQDIRDAIDFANELGVRHKVIKLEPLIEMYIQALPENKRARGNLSARVRMNLLYYHAALEGYLVAGTSDKSERQVGFFCYDAKTRALTKDGFKDYAQLKVGDTVFSIDLKTKKVKELPVSEIHIFDYEGKMAQLNSRVIDLMVSPSHKMLVHASAHITSRIEFQTIEKCLTRNVITFPIPTGWDGNDSRKPDTFTLHFHQKHKLKEAIVEINDLFYMLGLFIGDGNCTKGKITVTVKSNLTKEELVQLDHRDSSGRFAALLTTHVHKKTYDTYETDFALPVETKVGPRSSLCTILDKYDIDYSLSKNVVRISSKEIYDLFSQCGFGSKNKHIPKWILEYPTEKLLWLYKGLMESDGDHSRSPDMSGSYYTASSRLLSDFVELAIKLGKLGSWRSHKPKTIFFRNHATRPYFMVSGSSYSMSLMQKSKTRNHTNKYSKWVDYKGKIWCPEVPETHNLLVERNGKLVFCGNTKYGDGAADILPIADLYKTQVRALASYLKIPAAIIEKKSSPRLWKDHLAEEELGLRYEKLDPILELLVERKKSSKEVARKLGVSLSDVLRVKEMIAKSAHKRKPIPFAKL